MADLSTCPSLEPPSVKAAYDRIANDIETTPLLASEAISRISSTSDGRGPAFNLFFKCENLQRVGCFKVRGAFHALKRLIEEIGIEEVRKRGVVTHSSGNHAQSLALASHTYHVPAYIVMPSNAAPSKIAGTRQYCSNVILAGTNPADRQAVVAELVETKGAILIPPYDHPDIILGQGTTALEISQQYAQKKGEGRHIRAVVSPLGGGGMLAGTASWFMDTPTLVFGAEPSHEGANDAQRGLAAEPPRRVEVVTTTTIADGLRTPVGLIPWGILNRVAEKGKLVEGVYSVSEDEIKNAMRIVPDKVKVVIEPSSAVPLAVVLYNEQFRQQIWEKQKAEGSGAWDVAVVFTGGNATVDTIVDLFSK